MAALSRNVTKRLALGHSLPPSSPNCRVNRPLTVQRFRDMKLEIAERLQKWIIMQFLGSLSYHLERVNFPCLLHGLEHCKFPASYQHDTHTSHTHTAAYKGFAFFFFFPLLEQLFGKWCSSRRVLLLSKVRVLGSGSRETNSACRLPASELGCF